MGRAVRYGLSVLVFLFAAATQAEVYAAPLKVGRSRPACPCSPS